MTGETNGNRHIRWRRAEEYFITKNHASAERELRTLQQSSDTPIERAALTSNLQAVKLSTECDRIALEEAAQRCSGAAVAAGVGVGQRGLEVVVSARYNAALAFMKCGRIRDGVREAERGVESSAWHVMKLDRTHIGEKGGWKRGTGWEYKMGLVKKVIEDIDVQLLGDGRWMEAMVDVTELLVAGYVLLGKNPEAVFLLTIVDSIRKAAALVVPTNVMQGAKLEDEGQQEGECEGNALEGEEEDQESDMRVDVSPENSTARGREGGRGRCTLALVHTSMSNWHKALEVLQFDRDNSVSDSPSIPSYWPAVYLSAAVLFCRGNTTDLREAQVLFNACTAAFYRPAEASGMSSRVAVGDDALQAWKRTLALDHSRTGALWEAGRSLGRCGRHKQRYILLKCLREATNTKRESSFYSADCRRQIHVLRLACQSALYNVSERAVEMAFASTHAARGHWLESLEIIKDLDTASRENEETEVLDRIRAWVFVGAEKTEEAIQAAESTFNSASAGTEQAGILLAKAEALAFSEQIQKALEAVENAFDVAQLSRAAYNDSDSRQDSNKLRFLRGLCYNNRGVLLACLGNVRDADESFTAAERAFEKCERLNQTLSGFRDEITTTAAEFSLAASHNRCLILWRRRANKNAIAHWLERRGIAENADGGVSEQVLRKAQTALCQKDVGTRDVHHLRGKLEEREKARLDVVFIEKRKAAVAKERAGALLDDLQESW